MAGLSAATLASAAQAQTAAPKIETPTERMVALLQSPVALAIALGVFLALAVLAVLLIRRAKAADGPDALAVHSLVAMSQVAIADGRIRDEDVTKISTILSRLTGRAYLPDDVMAMLERLSPTAADLDHVGQDLSDKDRQIVLEAALNIAVADGIIQPAEYAVVSDLAQRMRIGADAFRAALGRIAAHLQTAQAA